VPLAGRPLLAWSLDGVLAAAVDHVIVAAPAGRLDAAAALVPESARAPVEVIAGGATRQESVALALARLRADEGVVLVHDAARVLTPPALIDAVRAAVVATGDGVVPALAPADTVKSVTGEVVEATLDRSRLAAVQTPQGFPAAALLAAYRVAERIETDDAAVFAAAGGRVRVIPGSAEAFKVTTRADLRRAEQELIGPGRLRTGIGVDVHAFDPDRPLALGGLAWPGEPGLAGHSDGDAVCHAVADALLSAAGLGDLGSRFGTDRPEEADRAGLDFVRRAVTILREAGAAPVNVAVQVVAVRPRIAGRRAEVEAVLTDAVGAPVSLSGTTTDGLGFSGRGEGLTAIATALVAVAGP
jgi:2-C-methyl-D-erythritol 4-phosphate cytidylyltransferase / 2-C-methyl-D-erythritol 2,4-cyclodiphosphate synthase